MPMRDELGERMKRYEQVSDGMLAIKTPVIIRIDGNAFHTFTKGFNKPFDKNFIEAMTATCEDLCKDISGCQYGFVQSDEISLFLCDYEKIETQPWFDYRIQKLASIAAAKATWFFNKHLNEEYEKAKAENPHSTITIFLGEKIKKMACFDARAFNIPKDEISNYFIWRQNDAIRNAILSVAQLVMPSSELMNKNIKQLKSILTDKYNVQFEGIPSRCLRGTFISKEYDPDKCKKVWITDKETPDFKEHREILEEFS